MRTANSPETYPSKAELGSRIITETELRIYKELAPMKKEDVDLPNGLVWIPDSKTASGVAEVPLTDVAVEAFRKQISLSGAGPYLFPNSDNPAGYQASFKKVWATTLRKAGVPYFRITISSLRMRLG